jgi:hypothetical protein
MKFLIELSHPKHYYQFRQIIVSFSRSGHHVKILARNKDVLLSLLKEENIDFDIYGKHKGDLVHKIWNTPNILLKYLKIVWKYKPDIIISKASLYAVLIKPFTKAKIIITPDSEVVWLTKKIVAPFSDIVITPDTFKLNFGKKHKRITGFFEECYLSPRMFLPDSKLVEKLGISVSLPYFILRFISWDASHDIGHFGFNDVQKIELVNFLSKYGNVYISAERENIPIELKKFIIKIPVNQIHNVIHYASFYIGDSQTMATEAALLGTPSFRFNSFVGPNDMSNFIILQDKYDLMRNVASFEQLIKLITEVLDDKETKNKWLIKRENYFKDREDLNDQIIKNITDN